MDATTCGYQVRQNLARGERIEWEHIIPAMRADERLEAGDMDGRRVWLRLLEAVQELTSKEPPGEGAAVH